MCSKHFLIIFYKHRRCFSNICYTYFYQWIARFARILSDRLSYSALDLVHENSIVEWLKGHKLVFQSVHCSKWHEARICVLK